jgi:hypothetical protein
MKNLEELLDSLILDESGPNITLRHYTNWNGLINIFYHQEIRGAHTYWSASDTPEISVIRPSGSIQEIDEIVGKSTCGYFEIEYHKANDIVRNLHLVPFNELWKEYSIKIDSIIRRYQLESERDNVIKNLDNYKLVIRHNDLADLKNWIRHAEYYLQHKEGEERLVTKSLPLNAKYMKFIFTKSVISEYDKTSPKWQQRIIYSIRNQKELFEHSNKFYKELAQIVNDDHG